MAENVAPVILTAMEISLSFGEQIIFKEASLSIHEGDRIGLVGRNGAGKSTFLKIISGEINPNTGNVAKKKNLNVGFLTQDFTLNNSKTVLENIMDGAESIINLIHEYENTTYDSPKRDLLEKEINEKDAKDMHIKNGDIVVVESRVGKLKFRTKVTKKSPPGIVFVSDAYADTCVNMLVSQAYTPVKMYAVFEK